jgi:hypothetical protein
MSLTTRDPGENRQAKQPGKATKERRPRLPMKTLWLGAMDRLETTELEPTAISGGRGGAPAQAAP